MALSDIKIPPKKKRRRGFSETEREAKELEPQIVADNIELIQALNWYNYFYTVVEGKPWLLTYIKTRYTPAIYEVVKTSATWMTPPTACWIARMANNGVNLPERTIQFLDECIKLNVARANRNEKSDGPVAEVSAEPKKKEAFNPYKATMRRIAAIMTEVEDETDKFFLDRTPFDLYAFLKGKDAPAQAATLVKKRYTDLVEEIETNRKDFVGDAWKTDLKFYMQMISDCDRFIDSKKVGRVRKNAAKPSVEKQVRNVKYKKEDPNLKLTSISPTNIIGAKVLIGFHTKYSKLVVYYAKDEMGLSVKPESTTIANYDTVKSYLKSIRKPEEALPKSVMPITGVRALETLVAALPYPKQPLLSRLNDDILLLKVFK